MPYFDLILLFVRSVQGLSPQDIELVKHVVHREIYSHNTRKQDKYNLE